MSSLDTKIQQCQEALYVMYSQSDVGQATRKAADNYLNDIQCEFAVWDVADRILTADNLPQQYYFYAANALVYRLRNNFDELITANLQTIFKQRMNTYLERFLSITESHNTVSTLLTPTLTAQILDRLCLALAILMLQLMSTGEWNSAMDDLIAYGGFTPQIKLQILADIPDALADKRVLIVGGCTSVYQRLVSFHPMLLNFLSQYLQNSGGSVATQVFTTVSQWCTTKNLTIQIVGNHPLFEALLQALLMPHLTGLACSALSGLLDTMVQSVDEPILPSNRVMVASLINYFQQHLPNLFVSHHIEGNITECKNILNLVSSLCSAAVPLIFALDDNNTEVLDVSENNDVGIACLCLLIRLTRYIASRETKYMAADSSVITVTSSINSDPYFIYSDHVDNRANSDIDADEFRSVLSESFDTVYALAKYKLRIMEYNKGLVDEAYTSNNSTQYTKANNRTANLEARLRLLNPYFQHLFLAQLQFSRVPVYWNNVGYLTGGLSNDETHEFDEKMRYFEGMVERTIRLLGYDAVLTVLEGQLMIEYRCVFNQNKPAPSMSNSNWCSLHAVMNTIHYASNYGVCLDDSPFFDKQLKTYKSIMEWVLSVQTANHDFLNHAALLISTSFSDVFTHLPLALPVVLTLVTSSLNNSNLATSACHCLQGICMDNQEIISTSYINEIIAIYDNCYVLSLIQQRLITMSVMAIASCYDAARFIAIIDHLTKPILTALDQCVTANVFNPQTSQTLLPYMERMKVIISRVGENYSNSSLTPVVQHLVQIVQKVSPQLVVITRAFTNEDKTADAACQWWKYIIDAAGPDSHTLIPDISTVICESFSLTHQSVYLYVASTIVKKFSRSMTNICFQPAEVAKNFFDFFTNCVLTLFSNTKSPTGDLTAMYAEVFEDFFCFLSIYANIYPEILLSSHFTAIYELAVESVNCENQYVFKAIIDYLVTIYEFIISPNPNTPYIDQTSEIYITLFKNNTKLLYNLFTSAMGNRKTEHSLRMVYLVYNASCLHEKIIKTPSNIPQPLCLENVSSFGVGMSLSDVLSHAMVHPSYARVSPLLKTNFMKDLDYLLSRPSNRNEEFVKKSLDVIFSTARNEIEQ